MIHFILNHSDIRSEVNAGITLLDFIRYNQGLCGTKIGCREGDCGACTVLVGELQDGELKYTSATSCLMAMGNVQGKHIVTVEGCNIPGLNVVQQAFVDEGATQCGFCTPGFVVSLSGYCLDPAAPTYEAAIDSMNGNICRCTGYKSIERAARRVYHSLEERQDIAPLQFAVDNNFLPSYFLDIAGRLKDMERETTTGPHLGHEPKRLAGGTDLYVQQHETMSQGSINFLFDHPVLNGITVEGNTCILGASVTVTDLANSAEIREAIPHLGRFIKLVSSTQIRNMATIAGNFSNASPIGDFTIFFLALNASLQLSDGLNTRTIPLRNFYKGYKEMDKAPAEIIEKIIFRLPSKKDRFHFEKVCKRTWLDIASVNSAIFLEMDEETIVSAGVSAGGVSPIPLYLRRSSEFLAGKRVTAQLVNELVEVVQTEISPISDVRGSEQYKRLLLSQLIRAHFIEMFPDLPLMKMMPAK